MISLLLVSPAARIFTCLGVALYSQIVLVVEVVVLVVILVEHRHVGIITKVDNDAFVEVDLGGVVVTTGEACLLWL